jgi:hypothetical protein
VLSEIIINYTLIENSERIDHREVLVICFVFNEVVQDLYSDGMQSLLGSWVAGREN